MKILGLHKDPWHNTAAAAISLDNFNLEPRFVYLAEERLNRVKDSRAFPECSIKLCMKNLGINSIQEFDYVVLDYIIDSSNWKNDYSNTPCTIDNLLLKVDPKKLYIVNHHLLHAYATYFSSGYDNASILIIDGRGSDNETQSLYKASKTKIELIEKTKKIGIGLMYSAVTQAIGFKSLQEGKTMGLAPYGAKHDLKIFDFKSKFNGIVTDYSNFCAEGCYKITSSYSIQSKKEKERGAYEAQIECERALMHLANYTKKKLKSSKLCLSGGVALNSVANNIIRSSKLFDDVFINPAASDTGIALGAALYGLYELYGFDKILKGSQKISPFLGPQYSENEIAKSITEVNKDEPWKKRFIILEDATFEKACHLLSQNFILACHQGRSEMGPRALGNRSILMSPLVAENKDRLNQRVKNRENFRPFACATLEHQAHNFFSIDVPSPYMLFVCEVIDEFKNKLPAITHVDGSVRLQTLTKQRNDRFYDLVEEFGKQTGFPVILNTSFNVAGEPIVETPYDAIKCFSKTDIDALLIGDYLLLKNNLKGLFS